MSTKKSTSRRGQGWSRQTIFNRALLAVALIIVVGLTAYVFSQSRTVVLPDYLDRCIPLQAAGSPSPYAYSSTPQLSIKINGNNVTIPGNIGILGHCVRPLHTFAAVGTIHIDTDLNRTFTLGDFFLVWGASYGPEFANFNSNQIFNFKTDSTHHITMLVNNVTDTVDFQNLVFPRNADTLSNPFQIEIRYASTP